MAGTPQHPGYGVGGKYHPDAQGHYHTGNKFFDQYYEGQDKLMATINANPEVAKLIASGGSGTVTKVTGDTDVKVVNGVITHTATGGVWKPLLGAAAVAATGGIAGAYVGGGAGVAAATAPEVAMTTTPAVTGGVVGGTGATSGLVAGGGTVASSGLGGAALRYGMQYGGDLATSLIQAHATGQASDAQQKYLAEALAYQKEQDAYQRTTEATRYGDYQGRIAPFIARGTSANARMADLLGLPAGSGGASGGGSGPSPSSRVAPDAATNAAIAAALQGSNSNDDAAYWQTQIAAHGDSAAKNWDYWQHRIDIGDGVGKGYAGAPTAPAAPSAAPAAGSPAGMVRLRGPDGSARTVPQADVPHYLSLGAKLA